MDQKIAFITGANRGIGFETARQLAEKNVHVILGCRKQNSGEEALKKLTDKGLKANLLVHDVTSPADPKRAFEYIEAKFGKLDILVNNAGVWLESSDASRKNPNQTSTLDMRIIRDTFEANFFGVIALTQTLLPLIRKSPAGRIVNLSSILASLTLHSDPNGPIYESKSFAYNASKTALNAFTVHLAHELKGTKIKVNSAHPGWVKTEMGGASAMMELGEGSQTSVELALLPENGPNGGFFHLGEPLPW